MSDDKLIYRIKNRDPTVNPVIVSSYDLYICDIIIVFKQIEDRKSTNAGWTGLLTGDSPQPLFISPDNSSFLSSISIGKGVETLENSSNIVLFSCR